MAAPKFATEVSQVIENIVKFNGEMHHSRDMIAYVRHWYAVQLPDRGWIFAPSKFIGYVGMNHGEYDRAFDSLDGRATENNLKTWFVELDRGSKLEETLKSQLRHIIAQQGKALNKLARIHVLKGEGEAQRPGKGYPKGESWRITADPEVLAGKPCIRGIRMRVADILEMLALGASRRDILEDYPYIEDADITAVLEYAMGAVDHRLVKAA